LTIEDRHENLAGRAIVSDLARFAICPPIRCCASTPNGVRLVCGEGAYYQSPPIPGTLPAYHCAAHRTADDRPMDPAVIFRRVSVTVEVTFAGASQAPVAARAEALARLEQAVEGVGGLINLCAITDVLGRYEPPERGRAGRPRRGKGEPAGLKD
jgi:hypothetical protein